MLSARALSFSTRTGVSRSPARRFQSSARTSRLYAALLGSLPMRFEGRTVVVTGGGSGIGRVMAKRFAAEGGLLVIADLLEADGQQVVAEIEAGGGGGGGLGARRPPPPGRGPG